MTPRTERSQDLTGTRVAVVNWRDLDHSLAGGSERYAWEFAQGLREAGARVDFVTARDRHQSRRDVVDGISVRRAGGRFGFYLHAAWYALRNRRRLDAVVDAECGIPTFAPLFLGRRTPVVLVLHHVHLDQFGTYFPAPVAAFGRFLEGWLMPRVYADTATVAVSESTREEMRSRLGWAGEVGLLPNGATEPDWSCDPDLKDPHRIVVLGRLVPHKRVDLIIRAVAQLGTDIPDLHLDVIGRGPEEPRLRALVAELGLEDCVTIHGFLPEEEKAEVLRRCALHVNASDAEGWGQVVIEAASHGVATVARDVPGLRDSIQHGETGWLLPATVTSHQEIVDHLVLELRLRLREVEHVETRRALRARCLHWASRFSWSQMRRDAVHLVAEQMHRTGPSASHKELIST